MTVHALIQILTEMPQDALIVIDGYEGGVNEVSEVSNVKIKCNVNTGWYDGKHEIVKKSKGGGGAVHIF